MRTCVILIWLSSVSFFCFSQDYLKSLIDGMSSSNQQELNTPIPVKSTIPQVFNLASAPVFVGISDPAIGDTLLAMNQAYARAVFMYALKNAKGRGVTDFFHDEDSGGLMSNYEELCLLQMNCSIPLSQCSFNHHQLSSGEIIVLLTVNPGIPPKNVIVNFAGEMEIYAKEISLDDVSRTINRISVNNNIVFYPSMMALNSDYRFHADSRGKISINSKFNEYNPVFEQYRYFYEPEDETELPEKKFSGAPVYHGLWYALISDVVKQISRQFMNEQVRVKQVGDEYQSKLISLNRETGTFDCVVQVQNIVLKNNSLHVMLSH